jgi:thioredoxin reductase
MPSIRGFAECWGISVIHCPYCHGYEVKGKVTGIMANGDLAFDFTKLVYNLTKEVTLFTNGKSTLTEEQLKKIQSK